MAFALWKISFTFSLSLPLCRMWIEIWVNAPTLSANENGLCAKKRNMMYLYIITITIFYVFLCVFKRAIILRIPLQFSIFFSSIRFSRKLENFYPRKLFYSDLIYAHSSQRWNVVSNSKMKASETGETGFLFVCFDFALWFPFHSGYLLIFMYIYTFDSPWSVHLCCDIQLIKCVSYGTWSVLSIHRQINVWYNSYKIRYCYIKYNSYYILFARMCTHSLTFLCNWKSLFFIYFFFSYFFFSFWTQCNPLSFLFILLLFGFSTSFVVAVDMQFEVDFGGGGRWFIFY